MPTGPPGFDRICVFCGSSPGRDPLGFLLATGREQLYVADDIGALLERMASHRQVRDPKWVDR